MSGTSSRKNQRRLALALGASAVLLVTFLHLERLDQHSELASLDLRFRFAGRSPAPTDILNVEIDDGSLNDLGRWPWPRETLAGIIDVLNECGARMIVLDIILPLPEETRFVAASAEVYGDDTGDLVSGVPIAVHDDAILARAIAACREHIFVPMHIAGRRLEAPALETAFARVIAQRPSAGFGDALALVSASHHGPLDKTEARRAYLKARAMISLNRLAVKNIPPLPWFLSGQIVPPLVSFAQSAGNTGFVTVEPDVDGIVRRIPLLADAGETFMQLGLAVAARDLGARGIACSSGRIAIAGEHASRTIPLDGAGKMLINWMPMDGDSPAWPAVRASAVARPFLLDKRIDAHKTLWRQRCLSLLKLSSGQFRTEHLQEVVFQAGMLQHNLDQLFLQEVEREAGRQRTALYEPARHVAADDVDAERQAQMEKELDDCFQAVLDELSDESNIAAFVREGQAPAAGEILKMIRDIPAANEQLARQRKDVIERLSPLIRNRICIIGSSATGAADFVPTPVHNRMPGMNVHANIISTIISGRFIREAPTVWNVAAIVASGLIVTFFASSLSAGRSAIVLLAVVAGNLALAGSLFHWGGVWLAIVAPLASCKLAFVVVVAYRQLTEEREKRHIRRMFDKSLSPALVDRLIEDPSLMKLGGERRPLSCFFSDLEGFTTLAERLGEQRTVSLLNRYFDHMTAVIQDRMGGYLNKFLGDGLFVFFGAPVFQDDHASRALRAAVACQQEVEIINRRLAEESGAGITLKCRIGVTTGEAMVGNCGSSGRMDYTAIGDIVNLAARLESANKHFGTRILVDKATWNQAAAGDVIARDMGLVVVAGRAEPVAVVNVLGLAGCLDDRACEQAREFSRAVSLFADGRFAESAEVFEPLAASDKSASLFLAACRRFLQNPPSAQWNRALILEGK